LMVARDAAKLAGRTARLAEAVGSDADLEAAQMALASHGAGALSRSAGRGRRRAGARPGEPEHIIRSPIDGIVVSAPWTQTRQWPRACRRRRVRPDAD
jgi:hypothetical protein